MNKLKIALVGQPNVGKSMLINAIANARLKVGNFSGVTVEKNSVNFKFQGIEIEIVDLPGSYSLNEFTIEERVTKKFLEEEEYDIIINVVDSTNLARNLQLTAELIELDKKMVIALNMMDEAKKEGICIDETQLSEILGVPCVKVSAKDKKGIGKLLHRVVELSKFKKSESKLTYSSVIEEEIDRIVEFLKEKNFTCKTTYRTLAVKLLQEDKQIYDFIRGEPIWIELQEIIKEALKHLYIHYNTKDINDIFTEERISFARGAATEVITCDDKPAQNLTQKIDRVLINKVFGIPIFLFFMWGLFQLTFEIGSIPMDYIDMFFAKLIEGVKHFLGDGELASVVGDGAIAGVGAVVMFLPNIAILFLGIALLETTGYMSRVAFLLDGFFHKFGLHGKSFIPLVTGFGCSVPAYMAARTLKNEKDRLITLFIIGFMSCGARLPIYVLFVSAFFPKESAGNILFLIYITGAIIGLIFAKILRVFVFKNVDEPFVMEMPKYRLPSFMLLWHTVYSQSIMYLKKAGTFILAASILVWFASNYPKNESMIKEFQQKIELQQDQKKKTELKNELDYKLLEQSYLGKIGKFTEPFFSPLGFDWKMSVSLEAGLAAKEVVVSTLSVLYALGDNNDEKSQGLIEAIRKNIPLPNAISFIVFIMLYLPCFAASMVFAKESGGWKYLVYLFFTTTTIAWIMSFFSYKIALMLL